jgi:arylsulfatase A-like enzyme
MNTGPNILWLVTTQWRAGACGYAGDVNARTPNLDALAAESVNHRQAVTPHPFGPFARAALLTGVESPLNGVREYHDPLPAKARTIAHAMRERGYTTAFFGKWHLAARDPGAPLVGDAHARMVVPPESRGGFEFWEGFEGGFRLNDPLLHGTRLAAPTMFPGYQSDVLVERAGAWAAPQPRPWFCVVSFEPPHPPYDAAVSGTRPRPREEIVLAPNVPRGGAVEAKARTELAGYHAQIEATDRAIGRLVGLMPRERTVVVFTSVHGDMHGAHGLFRKGWPYEESVRVPLLVRAPAVSPEIDDSPISLVDLAAMTVGWAEGKIVRPSPGASSISMPSVVALPHQCDRVWAGWRNRTRKVILNADGSPWFHFDLEHDPFEMHNLAADPGRSMEIAELQAMRLSAQDQARPTLNPG